MRKFFLMLVALAAIAPTPATAETIPPHINAHNGYIVVRNDIEIRPPATSGDMTFKLWHNGHPIQAIAVAPGKTGFFNGCCIAAGTMYEVSVEGRFGIHFKVRPQLCNVRGIPFGYAVVVVSGYVAWNPKDHFTGGYHPAVPTVDCPTS